MATAQAEKKFDESSKPRFCGYCGGTVVSDWVSFAGHLHSCEKYHADKLKK